MILLYDGSFEGFLSLVYDVYYKKLNPSKIVKQLPQTLILEDIIETQTNEQKATKVLDAVKTRFPKKAFDLIRNVFFCDTKEFELPLLKFIILGFKDSKELFNITNSQVMYLEDLQKELFRHVHKMYAFARFKELDDDTLYAKIESKFNVIYFLGRHFFKRFNNQKFIIHDINRKIAFIKNDSFIGIQNIASFEDPTLSENEEKFDKLWKTFFEAVSIESRENIKCQKNFVPLLYRTYMNEFDTISKNKKKK